MKKVTVNSSSNTTKKSRVALSPEARENQLISKAYNLAEQQLDDGTASAQVISYFLKLGSERNQIELERLRRENAMIEAKTEALKTGKHLEELINNALDAMKGYKGYGDDNDEQ